MPRKALLTAHNESSHSFGIFSDTQPHQNPLNRTVFHFFGFFVCRLLGFGVCVACDPIPSALRGAERLLGCSLHLCDASPKPDPSIPSLWSAGGGWQHEGPRGAHRRARVPRHRLFPRCPSPRHPPPPIPCHVATRCVSPLPCPSQHNPHRRRLRLRHPTVAQPSTDAGPPVCRQPPSHPRHPHVAPPASPGSLTNTTNGPLPRLLDVRTSSAYGPGKAADVATAYVGYFITHGVRVVGVVGNVGASPLPSAWYDRYGPSAVETMSGVPLASPS